MPVFVCYHIRMISKRKFASFVPSLSILIIPSLSLAAGFVTIVPTAEQGSKCNDVGGCQSICDIALLAQNLLNDAILFAVVVSAVLFAWAGWQYMTSGGNPRQAQKAKGFFTRVLIGLFLIVGAWLLVDTLINVLTGQSGLHWNRLC